MNKPDLISHVFYYQVKLFSLVGFAPRVLLLPRLHRLTKVKLFHLRDCICRKIIKLQSL